MVKHCLPAIGALLLAASCSWNQEPAPPPAQQPPALRVATLGAATRAPSEEEVQELGLEVNVRARGQVVDEVTSGGAAARAGIEPGDVLVKLDAVDLYSQDDIADFLCVSRPDQQVKALLRRAKTAKAETVLVSLGAEQVEPSALPRLEWQYASLGQMADALAQAKRERRLVLVGLSGAET